MPAAADRSPDRAVLAERWSGLHHGIDPRQIPLVSGWLRLMWAGGGVLARAGVPPTAVTITGVALAGAAAGSAPAHPVTAGVYVVGAALCDGLDGATAVVGDRMTASGRIADAVADRLCDGAFALVLRRRGAPGWVAGTAAGVAWGVDTLRRVRRVPSRVTVAERPTFTICAAAACLYASRTDVRWPAGVSGAVWIGAGVVGLAQLARTPVGPRGRHQRPSTVEGE